MKKFIDKKLFFILCLFYVIYNIINIIKNSILKYYKIDNVNTSWLKFIFDSVIVESFFSVAIIIFIIVVTRKMIDKSYKWYVIFGVHILLSLVSVIIVYIAYDVYLYYFGNIVIKRSFDYYLLNIVNYSNTHFLIYFVNVFIIYTYYYVDKLKDAELQRAQIKQQLTNVQVNVLKYQLHPHFFFNTLNSISSLIDIDPKLAQNTLADFSDLLRDLLFLKDTNLMPLSVEMKILKRYIDIMSIRFSDHLKVDINIDENLDDVLIPSLILQPIIENNIKHGYSYDFTELEISISIFKKEENLVIEIKNNGAPLNLKTLKYGTGLKNTEDRLKTLYNDAFVLSIQNRTPENGVKTILSFPIKLA